MQMSDIQEAIGTDIPTESLVLNYTEAIIVVILTWSFVQLLRQYGFCKFTDYWKGLATIAGVFVIAFLMTAILRQDLWLGFLYSIIYSGLTIAAHNSFFGIAPPRIKEFLKERLK